MFVAAGLGLLVASAVGCSSSPQPLREAGRWDKGYTVILPGIEGRSVWNVNVARGLVEGHVNSAIEIYDWTAGSVLLFPVNLRAIDRNKREARKIARKIIQYQDKYPGQPVHVIGHSGGGGVAVLVLEALPPNRRVSSTILLAAAIAPDYDLRRALRRTEYGIYNFYSPHDTGFLKLGTSIMGTIDGRHTSAAGARGFVVPWGLDEEGRRLYSAKLHQQRYTPTMARSGHGGGHFGWADRKFVAEWLAPILRSQMPDNNMIRYAADNQRSTSASPRGRDEVAPPSEAPSAADAPPTEPLTATSGPASTSAP